MKIANIAGAMGGSSRTYLTHLFGRGLDDEKYRVERFRSMAEGMIRPGQGVRGPGKANRNGTIILLCLRNHRRKGMPPGRAAPDDRKTRLHSVHPVVTRDRDFLFRIGHVLQAAHPLPIQA